MLLCSCASITRPRQGDQARLDGLFWVEGPQLDATLRRQVRQAARAALHQVETWGRLREPVMIVVHPDHLALEEAIGHHSLPWLRAWARYDRIDLQSPRSFGLRNPQSALRELLSHELTHVFMYQLIGDKKSWASVFVPFWFREGMASWTAQQGYRRGTLASLGTRLRALDTPLDPLLDGERLTQLDQPLSYGAAHWAFERLQREAGHVAILEILRELGRASRCVSTPNNAASPSVEHADSAATPRCQAPLSTFTQAFAQHIGQSERDFARAFRQSLEAAGSRKSSSGLSLPHALRLQDEPDLQGAPKNSGPCYINLSQSNFTDLEAKRQRSTSPRAMPAEKDNTCRQRTKN